MKRAAGPLAWMAAGMALTLLGAAAMERASAQGGGGFGGPPQGGPPQGGGFPGRPGGGFPPMMMGGGGATTMTATDKYVYILRANTLYQYNADDLKLRNRAELPRQEPQRPPQLSPDGGGE